MPIRKIRRIRATQPRPASEDAIQRAVARFLDTLEMVKVLAWHHPPNEGNRGRAGAGIAAAHGLKAGEPDCVIFPRPGVGCPPVIFIELKAWRGTVSDAQRDRHELLRRVGHTVHVVRAKTPWDAVEQVRLILIGASVISAGWISATDRIGRADG